MSRKISTYTNEQGVLVTVYASHKPRQGERTWTATRYSIANIGHQATNNGRRGARATTDRIGQAY